MVCTLDAMTAGKIGPAQNGQLIKRWLILNWYMHSRAHTYDIIIDEKRNFQAHTQAYTMWLEMGIALINHGSVWYTRCISHHARTHTHTQTYARRANTIPLTCKVAVYLISAAGFVATHVYSPVCVADREGILRRELYWSRDVTFAPNT